MGTFIYKIAKILFQVDNFQFDIILLPVCLASARLICTSCKVQIPSLGASGPGAFCSETDISVWQICSTGSGFGDSSTTGKESSLFFSVEIF